MALPIEFPQVLLRVLGGAGVAETDILEAWEWAKVQFPALNNATFGAFADRLKTKMDDGLSFDTVTSILGDTFRELGGGHPGWDPWAGGGA